MSKPIPRIGMNSRLDFGLYRTRPVTAKTGVRERQSFQHLSAKIQIDPAGISNFSPMDGASDDLKTPF